MTPSDRSSPPSRHRRYSRSPIEDRESKERLSYRSEGGTGRQRRPSMSDSDEKSYRARKEPGQQRRSVESRRGRDEHGSRDRRDRRETRNRSWSKDGYEADQRVKRRDDYERKRHRRDDDHDDRGRRHRHGKDDERGERKPTRRRHSTSRSRSPSPRRERRRRSRSRDHKSSRRAASTSPPPKRNRQSPVPSKSPIRKARGPLASQEASFRGGGDSSAVVLDKDGKPIEKQKPNFNSTGLLAKEANTVAGTNTVLKYHEPPEARKPPNKQQWRIYVFKGKDTVDTIHLYSRSCWLMGRDDKICDYAIQHPSASKQHAVVQFRYIEKKNQFGEKEGKVKPYLIDLESANGTRLNGKRVEGGRYLELLDGDVIGFGESEREYVVMLPPV